MTSQKIPLKFQNEHRLDFSQGNVLHKRSQSGGISAIRFFLDAREILTPFRESLNPLQADLLDIALACYVADRLTLRHNKKESSSFQWNRIFRLKMAVRVPEVWSSSGVKGDLLGLLQFLTDDNWNFEFSAFEKPELPNRIQISLFPPPQLPAKVALYSGGLDSFAGAVQEVSNFQDHSFVLVSGSTNQRQRASQKKQVRAIRKLSPSEIHHIVVPFGIMWDKERALKEESSQRTRGFLFLILGVIMALKAGLNRLHLYENGIGAINLPYNASQNGAMNSRATNPLFLLRVESLLYRITEKPFQIMNPFLFQTKGEMCKHQAVHSLANLLPLTFSCDGFPVRTAGKPQCGWCTSCLLRRLSLEVGGHSELDDGDMYIVDLLSVDSKVSDRQLRNLKAMEWQYQKLSRRLAGIDKWRNLAIEFPMLERLVAELSLYKESHVEELRKSILQLYEEYVSEWRNFSARCRLNLNAKAA